MQLIFLEAWHIENCPIMHPEEPRKMSLWTEKGHHMKDTQFHIAPVLSQHDDVMKWKHFPRH